MALNYKILQNKRKVKFNRDFDETLEVEAYDLLSQSFNNKFLGKFTYVLVKKEYIARPDLVSYAVYGTDEYADIICKLNGISNPFELNEGTFLYIPNPQDISKYLDVTLLNTDNSFINKGDTIQKRLTSWQKKKNQKRSPMQQIVGDSNYIVDDKLNIVVY